MDDPGPSSLPLFIALALVTANAFLAAAEFALIAVRRSRIEQNVRLGDPRSQRILPPIERLEELVFAAQLARSTLTVMLGWLAPWSRPTASGARWGSCRCPPASCPSRWSSSCTPRWGSRCPSSSR